MSRASLVRFAVASWALPAMGGAWVACSSSSASSPPATNTPDSSVADSAPLADAGLPPDDVGVAETEPAAVRATVTVVHAATGLFPVRLCLGVETPPVLISLVYPLPNNVTEQGSAPYLGIFPGTAVTLPNLTDLAAFDVTLYAVNAQLIASDTSASSADPSGETDCPTLLGTGGLGSDASTLVPNVDYVKLPTIPEGTFSHGNSFVVAIEGCMADPQGTLGYSTALCGASWVASTGNVSLQVFQVDNQSDAGTALGLQVIHASSAWDGLTAADAGAISNTFGVYDGVSDAYAPVAQGVSFGSITPADAAAPQSIVAADYASSGLYTLVTAGDGGLGPFTFSFPQIQAASGYGTTADGGTAGPLYVAGANFTAVWVGDPRQPAYVAADGGALAEDAGGTFNAASPHFVMVPSSPTPPAP
jgi:hypothetical protein